MLDPTKNIPEISVGSGSNCFTMERGSFNYKQKGNHTRKLTYCGSNKEDNGTIILTYKDDSTGIYYSLSVSTSGEDSLTRVTLTSAGDTSRYNRFIVSFATSPDEKIYGCGETHARFNLKGEKIRIWVAEHQNSKRIAKKLLREKIFGVNPNKKLAFSNYESYYVQPTFVSSDRYFVHVNTDAFSEFDFTRPDRITLKLQQMPDIIMGKGRNFEEISAKLSRLLGHQKLLPDWIYDGAIMAVQQGPDVINEKIRKSEEAGVKLVGIWSQDWCGCRRTGFGYQVMWNWEYDHELYKDLPEHIKAWNAKGIHFLGYINPFMAIEKGLYKYASEHGYCVKDKEGKDYLVTITTFPAAMIDLTNREAYEWYKGIIKTNMIDLGISGWMADFGEYLPVDCVLHSGEDPYLLHNRWPAIWAGLNAEAVREAGKENEVFFFTRAGHTGTIAHSHMMWTGDQHVDWSLDDGLASVIPATLSLAMSGFGVTHSDVGGYTTIMQMHRSKELLMRWEEMNAFTPLYRSHEGNQPVNNVQFADDDELLDHLKKCSDWHIALKDYIKDAVRENAENAVPVMRPLFYHYDDEEAYTEMYEYLLGRDILVAPVIVKGATERTVYLPDDTWVHVFSGEEFTGGTHTVKTPIGEPPVFVRKEAADRLLPLLTK